MTSVIKPSYHYQKTFSDIILSKDNIKNKEFEECRFIKLQLDNCTVEQCNFINCSFEKCNTSNIKPVNSSFNGIEFKESKVMGCDFTLAKKLDSLSFNNSQINYSNFRFLKLPKLKVINCLAKETDFTGTDLEGARFFKTNLTKANLKKATNYLIDIKSNTLTKAQFSYPEAINLLKSLDIAIEY